MSWEFKEVSDDEFYSILRRFRVPEMLITRIKENEKRYYEAHREDANKEGADEIRAEFV